MRTGQALLALAVCGLLARSVCGFYLPGVAPQDFKKVWQCRRGCGGPWRGAVATIAPLSPQKDVLFLKVNKLTSVKNQLPYEYYSLPYCRPEKIVQSAENLGEVLRGDRIENSLYQVRRAGRGPGEHGCSDRARSWPCRFKCAWTKRVKSYAALSRSAARKPRRSGQRWRTTTALT